jgi:hypothetical protein
MNGTRIMLLGLHLTVVGGFVMADTTSALPFSLDVILLFTGLWVAVYGFAVGEGPESADDVLPGRNRR